MLVTQNLRDFAGKDVRILISDRYHGVETPAGKLLIVHTYAAAAWLRGEDLPVEVQAFLRG
ncbi:hypothetical protein BH10PSE4_BH10PSE4_28360 [soil metagenome]